uniref:Complement C5 n=1 Tax=Xenopus tropicalis TaxID=8364 RepID=A0A803J7R2_XENTR
AKRKRKFLGVVFLAWGQYLVTGPREWRIGALETVVVQAFGQEGDLAIRINALSYPDKKTTYATQHLVLNDQNNYQGLVKLMIQPKDFPTYSSSDPMQFIYLQAQSNAFNKEEQVPVSYRNGFLFIQTDKPFYTPDQSVKIRVYSMDEELKPGRRKVVLTFKDPEEVKVDSIEEDDLTGIISFPAFKIPANPKFGMWTIEAAYGKDFTTSGTAKFEVKEYVLPKFFVSIEPEKNFICYDKFTEFTITVRASYYFKKLVDNAKVYIRYGLIQDGERTMLPKSIDLHIFQFNSQKAVEELGYSSLEEISGSYLYITVSVEESTGRTEESENVDVKFVLSPYTFKLVGTPLYVKPTLPYYIKVQLRDTMDKPVGNIPLVLSGDMVKEDGTSEPLTGGRLRMSSDKRDGTGVFVLNIPSDISSLDFKITTDDGSLPEDNQATVNHVAVSYQSLTKSYLYINWAREKEVLHVGSFLTIHLVPNSPYIAKLRHYSYLLISKGKILNFGTVQRVEGSDSQSLTLPITSDMVPSVRLLVYYIVTGDATAELVADSIWLDVVESCVNHQTVELSTRETTLKPGQKFNLKVSGPSKSLVALSAVDTAIYDVGKRFQRPLETVNLCVYRNPEVLPHVPPGGELSARTCTLTHTHTHCNETFMAVCLSQEVNAAMRRAEEYLSNNIRKAKSTFTLAIAGYALASWDGTLASVRYVKGALEREAYVIESGECVPYGVLQRVGYLRVAGRSFKCETKHFYLPCPHLMMSLPGCSNSTSCFTVVRLRIRQLGVDAETELMRVVPIFYVYHYLETSKRWDLLGTNILAAQIEMQRKMREGVNSILSFRGSDYSYSIWKEGKPSAWLTAFALKIFGEIEKYVYVNKMSVCNSISWLIDQCQLRDGSFIDRSGYQPGKLQGTIPESSTVSGVPSLLGDLPIVRYWKDSLKKVNPTAPGAESARMVETTAYALLMYLKLAQKDYYNPVVRWLKEQQRYGGGFYSTQDTAIALEALTEVSIVDKKLTLNMAVQVSYKKSGDFKNYRLTETSSFTRPEEVPLPEDLIVSTPTANGIATVHVRPASYSSPDWHNCVCSTAPLAACPEPLPKPLVCSTLTPFPPSPSGSHWYVPLLPLSTLSLRKPLLAQRVDQFVTAYDIEDGKVKLHFDGIPSDEYICVTLLAWEQFKVSMLSPGVFRVYEFHAPGKFYSTAPKEQSYPLSSWTHPIRLLANHCILRIYPTGTTRLNTQTHWLNKGEVETFLLCIFVFIHMGRRCHSVSLTQYSMGVQFQNPYCCCRYEYALDADTWVEWWPPACRTRDCEEFTDTLSEFSESMLFDHC